MPLIKSAKKEAIGENIKEMEASRHPKKQAIAAALNTAREAGAHIKKPHNEAHEMHHRHKEHR